MKLLISLLALSPLLILIAVPVAPAAPAAGTGPALFITSQCASAGGFLDAYDLGNGVARFSGSTLPGRMAILMAGEPGPTIPFGSAPANFLCFQPPLEYINGTVQRTGPPGSGSNWNQGSFKTTKNLGLAPGQTRIYCIWVRDPGHFTHQVVSTEALSITLGP